MKKYLLLSLILFSIFFSQAQTAIQPLGTGSSTDPYQIDTLPNLYWLSITDSIWGDSLCFIQTSDIDASDTRNWNIVGNDTMGFSPIGEALNPFKGWYKGKGHIISDLYINRPNDDRIALFGYTFNISIDSLGLINFDITGHDYTAGLIGYTHNNLNNHDSISYCYITGEVNGFECVGGLIGRNFRNNIEYCYSNGDISGKDIVGGLIGYNMYGSIKNCYNNSHVARCYDVIQCCGSYGLGGLVGNNNGDVDSCWNSGLIENINCEYEITGGLIGQNGHGDISNCYNNGLVIAHSFSGGLIGVNYWGNVQKSYNLEDIKVDTLGLYGYMNAFYCIGGLIGENEWGDIISCYSSSSVFGNNKTGGLIGDNSSGDLLDCYSLGYVNGYAFVGGFLGKNTRGIIKYCFTSSDVKGDSIVGGFVAGTSGYGDTYYCYSTGKVSGNSLVGGFIGESRRDISNCYSTGDVEGGSLVGDNTFEAIEYCYSIGEAEDLVSDGSNFGTYYSLYWDKQTSGFTTSVYGQGRNTSQMLQVFNFPTYNFDTIWTIREDTTYPALQNVNNAPFAFADNMVVNSTINLETVLLANDYDYETLQTLLVYKIISTTAHSSTINGDLFSFDPAANIGDSDTVIYRVGELLPIGDTLWGNRSKAIFHNTINTSIDEYNTQNISIYPNPCTKEFTIEGFEGKAKIEIYNINGAKLIETLITSGDKIATNGLSAGTYIVKLISKKENSSQLLIIKH